MSPWCATDAIRTPSRPDMNSRIQRRKSRRTEENGLEQLIAEARAMGKSVVAKGKIRQHKRIRETRVELPLLPKRRRLTKDEEWLSLLWMIDTAEAHGKLALHGLTIALARLIQAESLRVLFFDARPHRSPDNDVNDLLWDRNSPISSDGRKIDDLLVRRRGRNIELGSAAVIVGVWERWRLARALQNLGPSGEWGSWRQDDNHRAVAWYPWPLIWVDNGNHSTTAALLRGGGAMTCEASFDAAPLLRLVSTDGKMWFGENRRALGPVRSVPLAGIFEIGRRLL